MIWGAVPDATTDGGDVLLGNNGDDVIYGGAGNDAFVFVLGGGYDTIIDFTEGDIISIERTSTVTDAASALASIKSDAYGTFIDLGNDSGITLAVTQPDALDASDFLFYG